MKEAEMNSSQDSAPTPAESSDGTSDPAAAEPAQAGLANFLRYTLSLPERAVRSTVGVAAGAARETAGLLVPKSFQSSKTYEVVISNSLRFLTENIGGVQSSQQSDQGDGQFLARKAVGNFVDFAGMATLHASPLWIMAIVSDVAYGSKSYLHELAVELKQQGLIDETSTINQVDDVLDAVRNASGKAAGLFDAPPLSVNELKKSLDETRQAIQSANFRTVLPEAELNRYWSEMKQISTAENVSLLGVSGALTMHTMGKLKTVTQGAMTGVNVAGNLLNKHVFDHYAAALDNIREKGFYASLQETSAPYVEAVWNNFSADKTTLTDDVVSGRAFDKLYTAVKGWFGKSADAVSDPQSGLVVDVESKAPSADDPTRQNAGGQ